MLQFAQGFRFDLTDTFARHAELLTHLFERMICVHTDAKPHPQHTFLARRQRRQNTCRRFLQVFLNSTVQRKNCIAIGDEIAQLAVLFVPDRCFQRNRLFGNFHHFTHFFQRHLKLFSQFFWRWFPPDFMQHLTPRAHQFIDRFDHMNRNTDRAGLIRNRARDRLTDPPSRIGRKFVSAAIFKFIHRLHEADIALLDQIKKLKPAVCVFLCNGNDEAQVGFDHFFFRLARFFFALLNL